MLREVNGIPVYVKDVAEVRFGEEVRRGAIVAGWVGIGVAATVAISFLLVIPIEDTLLYVEPLYLRAERRELPAVGHGDVADGRELPVDARARGRAGGVLPAHRQRHGAGGERVFEGGFIESSAADQDEALGRGVLELAAGGVQVEEATDESGLGVAAGAGGGARKRQAAGNRQSGWRCRARGSAPNRSGPSIQ